MYKNLMFLHTGPPTDEWPSATRTMFIGNQGIFEQYILIEEKNS